MALSERLAYVLDFDVKGGIRSLEKVGATAEKELGKAEQKLDKISGNLTKFGTGAVAFAGVAGVALFKMGQGAAEAEASMAALEQVVGEVAATNVKEWAEDSAEGVGLASREATAAATQFAGLGKIIGLTGDDLADFAKDHVELAADMAAFRDVSPQQAIEDLQSAYAGSTEVLRKYNIFLDEQSLKQAYARETGEEVTGTLTTQQKIIAINSELYRQGADMVGQWGRESGELAGQQAILSANLTNLSDKIGAGLLPMLTKVVGAASEAAGALASMDSATGGAVGRFAALGTAGVGLLGTLSLIAGQVIKMRDRFTVLNADGSRSLNKLGVAAKGVGVAMGVASVALIAYSVQQQRAAQRAREASEAMLELSRVAEDEIGRTLTDAMFKAAFATGSWEEAAAEVAQTNLEGARRARDWAATQEDGAEITAYLTQAIKDEEAARKQQARTTEEYADAEDEATGATEDATEATEDHTDRVTDFERGLELMTRRAEFYNRIAETKARRDEAAAAATRRHKAEMDRLLGSIDRANSSMFDYESAQIAAERAANDFEQQLIDTNAVLNDSEAFTRDKENALYDAREAEIAAAEQALATAEAYAREKGAAEGSAAAARYQKQELERLAGEFPWLRDEIQKYIDQLNRIPRTINTTIGTTHSGGGTVSTGTRGAGNAPVVAADGGIVTRPTEALIGEAGPEAVIPLHKTPGASSVDGLARAIGNSGGGHTINLTVNAGMGTDGNAVGRQITEALESYFRNGGQIPPTMVARLGG